MVSHDTLCDEVERHFAAEPSASSVVVTHPDGRLEILTRRRFDLRYAGRLGFGRPLFARRAVSLLSNRAPTLILDERARLIEAGSAALARDTEHRYDDLVVLRTDKTVATLTVARLFSELAHLHSRRALHDPLTGLPNRDLFAERVREIFASGEADGAILFVDLDDFKAINDTLGHPAGDQLLAAVGDRLRATFRTQDTVARLSGDEFAVLNAGAGERTAIAAAERILLALAPPVVVGDRWLTTGASIGVALASGSSSPETLLRNADLAMYEAKKSGKHRYCLFRPQMYTEAVDRLDLIGGLATAVDGGQLHLVYQPVVRLRDGAIRGVEALLRWQHPTRGPIAPLDFIPLAEESGAIVSIGRWVLDQACRQLSAWQDEIEDCPAISMAVNVSVRQLESPGFKREVERVLTATDLRPEQLILEVTETSLFREVPIEVVRSLGRLGVRLAVDDFGTGYSTLSRLQDLPVSLLKIDKTFVDRLAAPGSPTGLLGGLSGLADSMGLQTVAEGIESKDQFDRLRELGCAFGQGFYMSRPVAPADIPRILTATTAQSGGMRM